MFLVEGPNSTNFPFPESPSVRDLHLKQFFLDPKIMPAKQHLNPSNRLKGGHDCDRRQTDRQTDRPHNGEM